MNPFLQKYGGWLLAGLSSAGVITTAVLAAKETSKAEEALTREKFIKFVRTNEYLTPAEKFKVVLPIYLPAIISGGLTIGTIFGNQALNAHQQAALITAGTAGVVIAKEYDQYRQAIRAEQGTAVDLRALERAKMTEEQLRIEIERLKQENGPFLYSISSMPGLIFEAKPADVYEAMLHYSRNVLLMPDVCLGQLYEFIGLPTDLYNTEDAEKFGWTACVNEDSFGTIFLDFDIQKVRTKNGIIVRLITMPIPPYDLSQDYDKEDVGNHFYPGNDPEQARNYIENLVLHGKDGVVEVDHPYLYRYGIF